MLKQMFIESSDGNLFRGVHRGMPSEIWNVAAKVFEPYKGEVPKPEGWGEEIDEARAKAIMGD